MHIYSGSCLPTFHKASCTWMVLYKRINMYSNTFLYILKDKGVTKIIIYDMGMRANPQRLN